MSSPRDRVVVWPSGRRAENGDRRRNRDDHRPKFLVCPAPISLTSHLIYPIWRLSACAMPWHRPREPRGYQQPPSEHTRQLPPHQTSPFPKFTSDLRTDPDIMNTMIRLLPPTSCTCLTTTEHLRGPLYRLQLPSQRHHMSSTDHNRRPEGIDPCALLPSWSHRNQCRSSNPSSCTPW